ncbi:MAG TPA: lipopolysaccharide assembly protein LapB [Stenotrophobium sp.]|nr:lipopolysaccharide assembly protein LapB [Stenotrophobium sp.]
MLDSLLAWLLLPMGAVLGWVLARRMPQPEQQAMDAEQLGGLLTHLTADDPDEAIAALTQAAEFDQSTAELHLTLGNLFRKRGEIDRALRIHETLLARPQLKPQTRHQVRFELAQDYAKAGLMDRAEVLLNDLAAEGLFVSAALEQLLGVYEQQRDWKQAIEAAQRLEAARGESRRGNIAQYYCELAEEARRGKKSAEAEKLAQKALDKDKGCVRASLMLAALAEAREDFPQAVKRYLQAFDQNPRFLPELLKPLQRCYEKSGDLAAYMLFLKDVREQSGAGIPILAEAQLMRQEGMDPLNHLATGLEIQPTRALFAEFLEVLEQRPEVVSAGLDKAAASLRQAVKKLMESAPRYQCGHCGFNPRQLFWQCPSCKQWGSITPVEDVIKPA